MNRDNQCVWGLFRNGTEFFSFVSKEGEETLDSSSLQNGVELKSFKASTEDGHIQSVSL